MLVRRLRALAPLALVSALGCGDIGRVVIQVSFPNEDVELRTRALEVVVRDVAEGADGCENLWSNIPTGLAEDRNVVPYPNRVDVRASPVDLERYPVLTFLIYAHPSTDVEASVSIAGGCAQLAVDPTSTVEVDVALDVAP